MSESTYVVVKNMEDQYSIWDTGRPIPAGWEKQQMQGTKDECLAYISEVWKDMRPKSLRRSSESR
jgi:MbtH protein